MKFDRSINEDGLGKYALLKLRNLPAPDGPLRDNVDQALTTLRAAGMLDMGFKGTEAEFMVFRLKDKYALKALQGYYNAILADDPVDTEYAEEFLDMMKRAGPHSPWCKKPD